MLIHQDFTGGNIRVKTIQDTKIYLENELRDSTFDWFYWAFCVEGAENTTLTFCFQQNRLGYHGPAVSHDLVHWHWLGSVELNGAEGESFTYTFGPDEHRVYFAHDLLYHPDRFYDFAHRHHLSPEELCRSRKGRSVPCLHFGAGERQLVLTARHHACEATGSYVLEGVLEALLANPLDTISVFCVPFVDFDGVVDGDQGKNRDPYDHNRDYDPAKAPIYPESAAIRAFADNHIIHFGVDFHSPWHIGADNDTVFVVQNSIPHLDRFDRFGQLLENAITPQAVAYHHANDMAPETGWNIRGAQCSTYLSSKPENLLAFTLETTYFGTYDNVVTEERLLELGHCFADALHSYLE